MNFFESFEFVLRVVFGQFDLAMWVVPVMVFLGSLFLIGLFWGLAWNSKWSFFGHWGMALLSLLCAGFMAVLTGSYRGAANVTRWIEAQRAELSRQLTSVGSLNREIFSATWEKLQPQGGQEDLTPPDEGGIELRLNQREDARVLAETAASAIKRPLLSQGPFKLGLPIYIRDPELVSQEVADSVTEPPYPIIVSPDNDWSRGAIANQVGVALDSASKQLATPMADLQKWLFVLIVLIGAIQLGLVALAACRDIKENPKIKV